MIDLKIANIRDVLPIISVEKVSDNPPTLEIRGSSFLRTTVVMINDINSPEFIVLSDERILTQIPESQKNEVITSIKVVSESLVAGKTSLLHFELSNFRIVSGTQRLVQFFVKLLLQSPGSDIFNKDIGGGLLKMIGQNDTLNSGRSVKSSILDAITRIKNYIITNQNQNPSIPLNEKLLDVKVNSLTFDETRTEINLNLTITTMSGQQSTTNLVV